MHKHKKENYKIKTELSTCLFQQIDKVDVRIGNSKTTLYIIGNGFDIAHGVSSDYRAFRDFIKGTNLFHILDMYIQKEDLWADFEESLGWLDASSLLSNVEYFLDESDVDDDSAADFARAEESAMAPAILIINELPVYFRQWVARLKPTDKKKPFTNLFCKDSRYINFNYTEFLETLYDISPKNILYIHGNRRNKYQELILGHANDIKERVDSHFNRKPYYSSFYTAHMHLDNYYDSTTKKSANVIKEHKRYFEDLNVVENVIVIGHSVSAVDYPYFREIINNNNKENRIKWQISWHSAEDIKRIEIFSGALEVSPQQISIFKL